MVTVCVIFIIKFVAMTYVEISKCVKRFACNNLHWPKIPNYIRIIAPTFYDICQRYALNMSLAKSSDTTCVTYNSLSQTIKFVIISATKHKLKKTCHHCCKQSNESLIVILINSFIFQIVTGITTFFIAIYQLSQES